MFNWGGTNGGGAGSRWRDLVPSRYADQIAATVRPWTERSQQWAREARMAGLLRPARTAAARPAATPLRRLGRLAAAAGCVFAAGVLLGASGGMAAASGTLIALAGLAAVGAAARMLWPLLSRGG